MFDMKQIETDILKPMILEHNQKKKQEKKKGKVSVKKEKEPTEKKKRVQKKKGEEVPEKTDPEVPVPVKEKKKRVYKKKDPEEVQEMKKDPEEVQEVKKDPEEVQEVKEKKKRGRKTKEQIVECKVDVNENEGNSEEDQLAELVNQITDSKLEIVNPRDIDMDDLDNLLCEEEDVKKLPDTPRLLVQETVPIPIAVTKEKVQKKKTSKKNKD
jgi:hypothetical protein